jgi:uncharacterized membrane protein YesL
VVRVLRVTWLAIRDFFDEFVLLMFVNLTWSLLCLPLLALSWTLLTLELGVPALLVSLLAVVPLAPATIALCVIARQASEGIVFSWRGYLAAIRAYARPAWRTLGLWFLGLLVIVVDIWFYSGLGNLFGTTLTIFWLYMLVLWSALLIYIGPLLALNDGDGIGLKMLARQTATMTFGRPLFTFLLLVLMTVLLTVSVIVPLLLVLVTPALLALISTRATKALLAEAEAARAAAEATTQGELNERGRRGQVRPRE